MEYISAMEASENWGVSLRQVQRLLAGNRVPRAKKYGRFWMIPADAEKPVDLRREEKISQKLLPEDIFDVIAATCVPMPSQNPDGILDALKEERLRWQYEGELAYLRGDFAQTMRCFQRTKEDEAARLRASLVAVAAAINLGDYQAYLEIEAYLKERMNEGGITSFIAELALASVAVSVTAPNMVPDWLKTGDFNILPPQVPSTYVIYLRAKYFYFTGSYEAMLAAAQTALMFGAQEQGIKFPEIYLRVVCAIACHSLEREDEARRWLLEAMRVCLPHGFITPFAETVTFFGGLMEQCLKQEFPDYYDAIIGQCKRTLKNWITFHNQFTKDNITLILSLREFHIALLVARRVPYAKIAKQHGISVGRLKNIIQEIYSKLYISGRDELAKYVH